MEDYFMLNKLVIFLSATIVPCVVGLQAVVAFRPYQLYTPPTLARQINITASGARGCQNTSGRAIDIKPLVPRDHVGQTISSHPTILFDVASLPSKKAYFSLVDRDRPEPLYEREIDLQKEGILPVSIPKQVTLKSDREYVWNLEVICDAARPSQNWYARGVIKRVSLPENLSKQLKDTNNNSQKIELLGKAGIWYDALSISYQKKADPTVLSYFNQLIEDIGIEAKNP
jgi:Domain of Unknown Function (DUF928)